MPKSNNAKIHLVPGTSRSPRSARTLLLQMAMEQEQREAMGQRIKELREARRLRQQAMADAVGVSLRAYQAWEAGDTGIKWENAEALAVALETSASHILHGDLEKKVDGTPDLFAGDPSDIEARLERIEQQLSRVLTALEGPAPAGAGGIEIPKVPQSLRDALTPKPEAPPQDPDTRRKKGSGGQGA